MQIARRVWWAWPLFALGQVPGMMILFRAIYRFIAARRTCLGDACQLPVQAANRRLARAGVPASFGFAHAAISIPAWVFMWLLAFSVFFGCKWLTWRRGMRQVGEVNRFISFGYFFGWVGMDAKKFLNVRHTDFKPKTGRTGFWRAAKTLAGAALIWLVARRLVEPGRFWPDGRACLGSFCASILDCFNCLAHWPGKGLV